MEISLKTLDEQAAQIKKLALIHLNEGLQEVCMGKREAFFTTFLTGANVSEFLEKEWNYIDVTPDEYGVIVEEETLSMFYSKKTMLLVIECFSNIAGGVNVRFPNEYELLLIETYREKTHAKGVEYPFFELSEENQAKLDYLKENIELDNYIPAYHMLKPEIKIRAKELAAKHERAEELPVFGGWPIALSREPHWTDETA